MKSFALFRKSRVLSLSTYVAFAVFSFSSQIAECKDAPVTEAANKSGGNLIPLNLNLPARAFKGTPKDIQTNSYMEPYDPDKRRPEMLVPAGLENLASKAKLSSSDKNLALESLAKITDGDKEASDQSIVFLRKGTQYVQLDLGGTCELFAIVLWHGHNTAKVYHSVIVQAGNDSDFSSNVLTLFNNDQENKSGVGPGTDREYFEDYQGKLINANGAKARYLRFYSKGSTESALNEYTEIEVYGRAAK